MGNVHRASSVRACSRKASAHALEVAQRLSGACKIKRKCVGADPARLAAARAALVAVVQDQHEMA